MRAHLLRGLSLVEVRLFLREPVSVVFALALPVVMLVVLGSVFGSEAERDVFLGVAPITYYAPAYVGLVMASVGLVTMPAHLATYREKGVLRRFHASEYTAALVLGAQVAVAFVVTVAGGIIVTVFCVLVYGADLPVSWVGVALAFVVGTVTFAAIGVLLGAVLPTARAALGAGVLLWFVMLIISGAGPPPEVLSDAMTFVANLTPLRHVITTIQDPWLGRGTDWTELAVVAGIGAAAWVLAVRLLRWQ